jgi:hypothetical protein
MTVREPGPDSRDEPGRTAAPSPGRHREGVHPATVATFGRMTGVDLGFVPVIRTPEASAGAAQRGAQAFTRRGVVHLPQDAGPMDRADTQALLGHELAHVLQQRLLGELSDENGPLGPALESQAQAVERSLRGEQVDPTEWELPAEAGADVGHLSWTPETGFSVDDPDDAAFSGAPAAEPPHRTQADGSPGVQRAALASTPGPGGTVTTSVPYDGGPQGAEPDAEPIPLQYPLEQDVPSPAPSEPAAAGPSELSDDDVARIAARLPSMAAQPGLDPQDPGLLDVLAVGLYSRIRTRLRSELITDRERAGVLTEFH